MKAATSTPNGARASTRGRSLPERAETTLPRTPWIRLGRLLPATLRTRVFEPAYFDLLADHGRSTGGDRRLGWRVIVLALDTYRVGGPRLAWDLARGSRRTWVVLALALLAIVAFLLIRGASPSGPLPYRPAGP